MEHHLASLLYFQQWFVVVIYILEITVAFSGTEITQVFDMAFKLQKNIYCSIVVKVFRFFEKKYQKERKEERKNRLIDFLFIY